MSSSEEALSKFEKWMISPTSLKLISFTGPASEKPTLRISVIIKSVDRDSRKVVLRDLRVPSFSLELPLDSCGLKVSEDAVEVWLGEQHFLISKTLGGTGD